MESILQNPDFLDDCWEPPETEYQPLLDFELEIFDEVPYNDIAVLTQRIKRSFLDYCRQGIMLEAVRRNRLYKQKYKDFAHYCKNALGRSIADLLPDNHQSSQSLHGTHQIQI